MKPSIPRRAILALVMAFAIIVLTPTPLPANTYISLVFYAAPLMVVGRMANLGYCPEAG